MTHDASHRRDRVPRKEILGWCIYDVADSGFTTVIVTALFPLYFGTIVVGNPARADFLWGLAASVSEAVVAILAPILGAIADFSASRKRFLAACAAMIVLFTASLSVAGPGMSTLALVLFILANIGFAGGGVFIDSFLPGISNPSNAGRISGLKWAMGYTGGLVCLVLCMPLASGIVANPTAAQLMRARMIPLVVALYYVVFSLPTFLLLRERGQAGELPPGTSYVALGFRQLVRTFGRMRRYRQLFKLLLAFLFYNDGIVTIIYFSARFAQQSFGFSPSEVGVLFIAMNVIAAAGALSFGWLADRIGQKRTIQASLCIWLMAVATAYFATTKDSFYAVAALAGVGIGSAQSVTRSLISVFTPKENSAEFYGFLGVSGKATAFLGPLLFGSLSALTGSQRIAMLSVGCFFLIGLALLSSVDEEEGRRAALTPVEG